jgi:dienelactone hydrolase
LNDRPVLIRATGLAPESHVVLKASLVDGGGHHWSSESEFVATDAGEVDTANQAPVKGAYKIVSAMGPVWSMRPQEHDVAAYQSQKQLGPQTVTFELVVEGKTVASAELEQLEVADGVKQTRLEGEIHGVAFTPAGAGPFPAVLVLGGSEGGIPADKAAWLASHGYFALALAYFRVKGLPEMLENIPLEYFGKGLSWLKEQPNVSPEQIGVVGTSRGGELALQLGAVYPEIHAVVAYVPANVRYPACCGRAVFGRAAWTVGSQALAFSSSPQGIDTDPRALIRVEKTRGPILMISGGEDGVWESKRMASTAMERLKSAHFEFATEHLSYPHAGHRAGLAKIIPTWTGEVHQPVSGAEMRYGGTPEGNALSSADAGPKVLEFLRVSFSK